MAQLYLNLSYTLQWSQKQVLATETLQKWHLDRLTSRRTFCARFAVMSSGIPSSCCVLIASAGPVWISTGTPPARRDALCAGQTSTWTVLRATALWRTCARSSCRREARRCQQRSSYSAARMERNLSSSVWRTSVWCAECVWTLTHTSITRAHLWMKLRWPSRYISHYLLENMLTIAMYHFTLIVLIIKRK